eukprot:13177953-Alexandrium_andersonii.AAC.1
MLEPNTPPKPLEVLPLEPSPVLSTRGEPETLLTGNPRPEVSEVPASDLATLSEDLSGHWLILGLALDIHTEIVDKSPRDASTAQDKPGPRH